MCLRVIISSLRVMCVCVLEDYMLVFEDDIWVIGGYMLALADSALVIEEPVLDVKL